MSFFGFDTSLPRDKAASDTTKGIFEHNDPFAGLGQARKLQAFQDDGEEELNFDDTYDGLGDQLQEAGDDLNDDTFGATSAAPVSQATIGRDFDFFGNTAQVSGVIDEEQARYQLHDPYASTTSSAKPKKTGYEKYQDPGYIPDIQAKSGAWSSKVQPPSSTEPANNARISTSRDSQPARKAMTLEEIEAQMKANAQPPQFLHPEPFPFPQAQPPQQTFPQAPVQRRQFPMQPVPPPALSPQLPEVAAVREEPAQPLQILQNPNRPRHSPHQSIDKKHGGPGGPPVITSSQQLMQLSEDQRRVYLEEDAKRAKRNHKIFLLSRGNGLMTPQDKNFITRIQLQQLVSATGSSADLNPEAALTEDFYYQVYSQIRGAPRQHPGQPLGHFAQTYLLQTGNKGGNNRRHQINGDNHMQRMQQQVQRAVEAAKLKPKNKQLIIEGSLGKISFSNAKTPKPLLNLKPQDAADARPASHRQAVSRSDRRTVLKNIEAVYTYLMRLEDHERRMPPPPQEGNADAVQTHIEWRQEYTKLIQNLWQNLKVLDPIVPGAAETHPFIALLSFAKGKKTIPRVFRLIDQEQRLTFLTMIIVHLDQLDVVRQGKIAVGETQPSASMREEIDLFSQAVMPCLLSYVNDAPIGIITGLLGLILDHTSVIGVVQTKIGLGMLTMLLSRAELVKETGSVGEQDAEQWATLYDRFFDTLEPMLPALFPGPVNSGDDMYIWQFLAAVGIGASPDQQQRLVLGVKDRVMETVSQSRTLPADMSSARLGNVNLFMRAIGLDVEMLG